MGLRKRSAVMLAAILSALVLAVSAPSASAYYHAGDCSKAYVIFYADANFGGHWVKSCYGTTDGSFTGGLNGIAGYYNENWHDRVSSFQLRVFVSNVGLCTYRNDQFSSNNSSYAYSVDVYRIDAFNNDEMDSMNWGTDWNHNGSAECSA